MMASSLPRVAVAVAGVAIAAIVEVSEVVTVAVRGGVAATEVDEASEAVTVAASVEGLVNGGVVRVSSVVVDGGVVAVSCMPGYLCLTRD
jgi:hypothetical protein